MMYKVAFLAMLAHFGQSTQNVFPTALEPRPGLLQGHLSCDGQWLYSSDFSVFRKNLSSGSKIDKEVVHIGLYPGDPPIPWVATTSQGVLGMPKEANSPTRAFSEVTLYPRFFGDARGSHLMLVAGSQKVTEESKFIHIMLTEIRFDVRGKDPNPVWLVKLPIDPTRRMSWPIGADYEGTDSVRLLILQIEPKAWNMVRYVGNREHPEIPLKETKRWAFKNYPFEISGHNIVPNSFDEVKQTYVRWEENDAVLADLDGNEIRRIPMGGSRTDRNNEIKALWELTVPTTVAPSSKTAWEPCATSADRKYWLLLFKTTGEYRLWKR